MITDYQFGLMIINGHTYNYDIEVRWDGNILPWVRKEGHIFNSDDVQRAINIKPEIIIFGTGDYGMARVAPETLTIINKQGIKAVTEKTPQAVQFFNNYLKKGKRVIGLFHLTC